MIRNNFISSRKIVQIAIAIMLFLYRFFYTLKIYIYFEHANLFYDVRILDKCDFVLWDRITQNSNFKQKSADCLSDQPNCCKLYVSKKLNQLFLSRWSSISGWIKKQEEQATKRNLQKENERKAGEGGN